MEADKDSEHSPGVNGRPNQKPVPSFGKIATLAAPDPRERPDSKNYRLPYFVSLQSGMATTELYPDNCARADEQEDQNRSHHHEINLSRPPSRLNDRP